MDDNHKNQFQFQFQFQKILNEILFHPPTYVYSKDPSPITIQLIAHALTNYCFFLEAQNSDAGT